MASPPVSAAEPGTGETGDPPWQLRKSRDKPTVGRGVIDQSVWPDEPVAPPASELDVQRFTATLQAICGRRMGPKRAAHYAAQIVEHAASFEVDAFAIAALMYERSGCESRARTDYGFGPTLIEPRMHHAHISDAGIYTYWVLEDGAWAKRELDMSAHAFKTWHLLSADTHFYFAAALLRVYTEQLPTLRALGPKLRSVQYRHAMSNYVWGDRVRDADMEERALIVRRRAIGHYLGTNATKQPTGKLGEVPISSPLDGAPRKLISVWGDVRDEGKRLHRGVDFWSDRGEPVRAVAPGEVVTAGADLKGKPTTSMSPRRAKKLSNKALGKGGLLVKIDHGQGVSSAYMHLDSYVVEKGQRVERGELIGYVGRSGCKGSAAHLHFELRVDDERVDPQPALGASALDPTLTESGQRRARVQAKKKAERQKRRQKRANERWKRRLAKKKAAREAAKASPGQ